MLISWFLRSDSFFSLLVVNWLPAGHSVLLPYITVRDARKMIKFYTEAFGAKELFKMLMDESKPDSAIVHAEMEVGGTADAPAGRLMMAEASEAWGNKSPLDIGGTPVGICLYVPNVDEVYNRAVAAGGKVEKKLQDQFYGDRRSTPSGRMDTTLLLPSLPCFPASVNVSWLSLLFSFQWHDCRSERSQMDVNPAHRRCLWRRDGRAHEKYHEQTGSRKWRGRKDGS
jgi:PhnB protein